MFSPASGDLLHFPPLPDHRRWRPSAEHAPSCPRCASPNTKFCYYNNYSLSQPRYFCKGCKRYWTKGGSLRNVPVGGGCRKNRRRRAPREPHTHTHTLNNNTIAQPGGSGLDPGLGSGIDLAVVYANFLNPSASSGSEQEDGPFASPEEGNNLYDSSPVMYPVDRDGEPELLLPGQEEHGLVGMGSFHDYNNQIQSLLEDGLVQDALWSSPDQTRPEPDLLTWQSVMQLQDLDLLHPGSDGGDCLKMDSGLNLTVDNWSSFNFQCI